MVEGPVERGGPRRVMRHEDDPIEVEGSDDGLEILPLLGERVAVLLGLVRLARAKEVERHHVASLEVRDEEVVEVVVVGDSRASGRSWALHRPAFARRCGARRADPESANRIITAPSYA